MSLDLYLLLFLSIVNLYIYFVKQASEGWVLCIDYGI